MNGPILATHLALAYALIATSLLAPIGAAPNRQMPAPPTEPPTVHMPAGPYRVHITDPAIQDPALEALDRIEQGADASLHDPFAQRVLRIDTMPTVSVGERTGLGVAIKTSLNGHVTMCEANVAHPLPQDQQVTVLVHEILHCVGLGHADSGIMSGGYEPTQQASPAELDLAGCILEGTVCETPKPVRVHAAFAR